MWELILKLLPLISNYGDPVLSSVTKYWKIYLAGAAIALQLFILNGWRSDHAALKTERAVHQADINSYKQAQIEAAKKVVEVTARFAQENKVKADEADKNYATLYATYHASLLRYQANQGVRSRPGSGQQTEPAQKPDGPSGSPVIPEGQIMISTSDADVCAVNTARLQSAHDWAVSLAEAK